MKIMDLEHKIKFLPCKDNGMADLLSRLKIKESEKNAVEDTEIGLFMNTIFTEQKSQQNQSHNVNMVELNYQLPNWTVEQQLDSD